MSDAESGLSKKLVIFDRFYRNPTFDKRTDSITDVIDGRHQVLAHAYSLASAVDTLLAIKDSDLDTPDVIVTGGLLEGEREYVENPKIVTTAETRQVRGLRGKKEKIFESHRQLLPVVGSSGDAYLPHAYQNNNHGVNVRNIMRFKEGWIRTGREMALSGFVIGHLAKELLGDKDIKVIGHASSAFGEDVPIDAFVNKQDFARPLWLAEEIETPRS